MISVTPDAAKHIKDSAETGQTNGMRLRIAVTKMDNGDFHYALGFDDNKREGDEHYTSEGVDIVVALESAAMLSGTVIDYVDIDGSKEIIFVNPNDPAQNKA